MLLLLVKGLCAFENKKQFCAPEDTKQQKKYLDPVLQLLARLREYKYAPFTCMGLCASEDKKKYFGLVVLRV